MFYVLHVWEIAERNPRDLAIYKLLIFTFSCHDSKKELHAQALTDTLYERQWTLVVDVVENIKSKLHQIL